MKVVIFCMVADLFGTTANATEINWNKPVTNSEKRKKPQNDTFRDTGLPGVRKDPHGADLSTESCAKSSRTVRRLNSSSDPSGCKRFRSILTITPEN